MAEAESETRIKKPGILGETPVRLTADAQYSGNSAGQVFNGQAILQMTAIPLALSGGGGFLNLNYMKEPLGFGAWNVRFSSNFGTGANMFGRAAFAVIPSSANPTQPMYFENANLGATWNLVQPTDTSSLRGGVEATTRFFEVPGGLNQQYETLGAGLAFGYRQLSAYLMARAIFTSSSPIKEFWTEDIHPWPDQVRLGVLFELDKGAQIGAEVDASEFEVGGKLSYKFSADSAFPTRLNLTYRHVSKIFGGVEVGAGIAVELDRNRGGRITASAQQEFGGQSLDQSRHYTMNGLSSNAVTAYLYATGRISAEQMIQRLNPEFVVTGTRTVIVDGKPELVVTYTEGGVTHTIAPMTKDAANHYAKTALGGSDYAFLDNLISSGSLQNFAGNYAHTSTDEKVMIASRIAMLALRGYNKTLEDASPFSSDKKQLAALVPDAEFSALQKAILDHKAQNEGICGNINGMAAEFLRLSGVEAYTLVVGSAGGAHAIAAARDEKYGASYAISYGNVYKTPGSGMWPAIQAYSRDNGILLIGAFVYGKGNEYMGYIKGPEGRLLDVVLNSEDDAFRDSLTRRRE